MRRLGEIHANLVDPLAEAKEQGWLGEVAAIETTVAAATQKLTTMQVLATQRSAARLGMPGFGPTVGRQVATT